MTQVKKKIFITGVAGFLGSHLADELIRQGHEVFGCDNLVGGYVDNIPTAVRFSQADCADLDKMKELLKGMDIVYHTACTAHEALSVFSPSLICRNTFQITAATASAAVANGVKRFVFCSSIARYGHLPVLPFTEDMTPQPQDPYGISKLASEQLLNVLSAVHGMEVTHAVMHNIIGPRQKYDDPFRNVAAIMINMMLQGQQPIIYGDGQQKRSFTFVGDIVDSLAKLGLQDGLAGEVINIGPDDKDEFVTVNQLARTIAKLLDFDLKPVYVGDRPQDVKLATCSADKARRLLGYKTATSLEAGLQQMIDYIKRRGPKKFTYHLDIEIINDKTPKAWVDKLF